MTDPSSPSPGRDLAENIGRTVAKGVLGAVPLVGSLLGELTGTFWLAPAERRLPRWMGRVNEALSATEGRVDRIERDKLAQDAEFVTTLHEATAAAVKNHHEEKLRALTNTVVNSAFRTRPNDSKRTWFLATLETFSPLHLALLHFCARRFSEIEGRLRELAPGWNPSVRHDVLGFASAFMGTQADKLFVEQVLRDLSDKGLVVPIPKVNYVIGSSGWMAPARTVLGDEFVAFISEPPAPTTA